MKKIIMLVFLAFTLIKSYSQVQSVYYKSMALQKAYWDSTIKNSSHRVNLYNINNSYIYCFVLDKDGKLSFDTTNLFVYSKGENILYGIYKLKKDSSDYELIIVKEGDFSNFRVFELIKSSWKLSDSVSLITLETGNPNPIFNKKVIASIKSNSSYQYLVESLCESTTSKHPPGSTSWSPLEYYRCNRTQHIFDDINAAFNKLNYEYR